MSLCKGWKVDLTSIRSRARLPAVYQNLPHSLSPPPPPFSISISITTQFSIMLYCVNQSLVIDINKKRKYKYFVDLIISEFIIIKNDDSN